MWDWAAAIMTALGVGSQQAATQAGTQAAAQAATQAAAQGAMQAGTQAATQAATQGMVQGATQGALQGALQSAPQLGKGSGLLLQAMANNPELYGDLGVTVGQTGNAGFFHGAPMAQAVQGSGVVPLPSQTGQALGAQPSWLKVAGDIGVQAAPQLGGPVAKALLGQGGGGGGGGGTVRMPQRQRATRPVPSSLGPVGGDLLSAVARSPQRDFLLQVLMGMGKNLGR